MARLHGVRDIHRCQAFIYDVGLQRSCPGLLFEALCVIQIVWVLRAQAPDLSVSSAPPQGRPNSMKGTSARHVGAEVYQGNGSILMQSC